MSVPDHLQGYRLNVGSVQPDWYNIDNRAAPGLDCLWNLSDIPWPLINEGAIVAKVGYAISRIDRARWGFLAFMDELYRILKPGASLSILTYYGVNGGYLGDPAACNPVTEVTWYAFDPEVKCSSWYRYQPMPWRIADMTWDCARNIEVLLVKR